VLTASIELHEKANRVARIPDTGLIAAAKLVKKLADEQARRVASGGTMNGKHRKPIRLRARDEGIRSVNAGRAILIRGNPAGPWVWMTSGTAPHAIRRRKKGPMRKMTVHHPGMRGKQAWSTVIDRSTELVPRIFHDLTMKAVG
jgi:hypothetical protein